MEGTVTALTGPKSQWKRRARAEAAGRRQRGGERPIVAPEGRARRIAGLRWPWLLALLVACCATDAAADPVRGRILRGLEVQAGTESAELRIRFGVPIRYVRHTPASRSHSVTCTVCPASGRPLTVCDRVSAGSSPELRIS